MNEYASKLLSMATNHLEDAIQIAILEIVYRSDTPVESVMAGVLDSLSDWEGLRGPHLDGWRDARKKLRLGQYRDNWDRSVIRAPRWDAAPPSRAAVPNAACEAPPTTGVPRTLREVTEASEGRKVSENYLYGSLLPDDLDDHLFEPDL